MSTSMFVWCQFSDIDGRLMSILGHRWVFDVYFVLSMGVWCLFHTIDGRLMSILGHRWAFDVNFRTSMGVWCQFSDIDGCLMSIPYHRWAFDVCFWTSMVLWWYGSRHRNIKHRCLDRLTAGKIWNVSTSRGKDKTLSSRDFEILLNVTLNLIFRLFLRVLDLKAMYVCWLRRFQRFKVIFTTIQSVIDLLHILKRCIIDLIAPEFG